MKFYWNGRRAVGLVIVAILMVAIGFNNCGPAPMNTSELPTSTPQQIEAQEKTSFQSAPRYADSRLDWNFQTTLPDFQMSVANLSAQCTARHDLFMSIKKVVPVIIDAGLMPNDPRVAEMKAVKESLVQLPNIAFCSYFASTREERQLATSTVIEYMREWAAVYVGDGNPINDRFFVHLIRSVDLILPKLKKEDYDTFVVMLNKIDANEKKFMGALPSHDDRLKNNWMLRHLMIRTYIALFTQNTTNIAALKTAFNNAVKSQYTAPSGWSLSSCGNLRAIGAYGSFDLQQRDAFGYHVDGMGELMPLFTLAPTFFDATSKEKILTALEVTMSYTLKVKSHPEFTCTTVQYDRDKIKLDPSVANPWDPYKYRTTFRHARLAFPKIASWTFQFLTPDYHPWEKVYFTGKGDALNPPLYDSKGCTVQYPPGLNYSHQGHRPIYDLGRIRTLFPKEVSSTFTCRTDIPYIPVPFVPPRPLGSTEFNAYMAPANDYLYRLSTITDTYMQGTNDTSAVASCALDWLYAWSQKKALTELSSEHPDPEGDYQRALINSGLLFKYAIIQKDPTLNSAKKAAVEAWLKTVTARVHDFSYKREKDHGGVSNLLYWMGLNDLVGGLMFGNSTWINRGVQIYDLGLGQIRSDGLLASELQNGSSDFGRHLYALRPLVAMAEVGEINGLSMYSRQSGRVSMAVQRTANYFLNFSTFPGANTQSSSSVPAFYLTSATNQLDFMEIHYSRFATPELKSLLQTARQLNAGKLKNSRETSGNMTIAFGAMCL